MKNSARPSHDPCFCTLPLSGGVWTSPGSPGSPGNTGMADNIAHGVPVEGTNVAIGTLMRAGSSSAAITVATVITTSGVLDLSERTVRLSDSDLAAALTLSQHEQAGAKGVHRLILAGCTLLSDASMHTVCANCDLYELDLSGCHGLSDAGLQTLVKECEHLTTLILHDLTALTDDAFAPLSGDCKGAPLLASLSTLNLSRCQALTDGAISLLAQCPLKDLNVSLCKQVGLVLRSPSLPAFPHPAFPYPT
jgi:hypothetical protein